jgi:hypothetical protein
LTDDREILLADADVLIDYVASELSILTLASEHIGQIYVLKPILATVDDLSERKCMHHGIRVIDVETAVLLEAGAKSGPLSFEDWLCLIVCRDRGWTCLTNDAALGRECGDVEIHVRRGLGLMVDLVHAGVLDEERALRVASAIHEENPYHINATVLEQFQRALAQD